jgi:hypothetical protein
MLGYDTDRADAAVAACIVHVIYASRDRSRFKVDTEMWARIERFVKSAAKRSGSLGIFVERLKPRLSCDTVRPSRYDDDSRDFMTGLLSRPPCDAADIIRALYRETSLVVLLVRDRIEREKTELQAAA